jgi:hypothetical protein
MLRRILTVLFTAATLCGITAPAFASPASASPASSYSVQICAHLNTNYCLSSEGIGAQVLLTDNDRTTYNVESQSGTDLDLIVVFNEPGHCVTVEDSSIVITSTVCTTKSALWTITNDHYYNEGSGCYLAVFGAISEYDGLDCVSPSSGWDWTWVQVSR